MMSMEMSYTHSPTEKKETKDIFLTSYFIFKCYLSVYMTKLWEISMKACFIFFSLFCCLYIDCCYCGVFWTGRDKLA